VHAAGKDVLDKPADGRLVHASVAAQRRGERDEHAGHPLYLHHSRSD